MTIARSVVAALIALVSTSMPTVHRSPALSWVGRRISSKIHYMMEMDISLRGGGGGMARITEGILTV